MDYETEKLAVLAEKDFVKLADRAVRYDDAAVTAARRGDTGAMHDCIRLGHWVMFREADFTLGPLGPPIVDEHDYALVGDTSVEAFASAIEVEPPPDTFDEALTLARASRGN